MLDYLLVGLVVSVGWHIGKVIGEVLMEITLNNLHKADWYGRLNKKIPVEPKKIKKHDHDPYKGTVMGFKPTEKL